MNSTDAGVETPLISVIVAVMNGVSVLERCIKSVLQQSLSNVEIIVIDGGSTDGTVGILEAYDREITYWESRPDFGIYHAWNKALKHVRGDWICFLGADDWFWDAHVLERMAPHLSKAYPPYRIVYGSVSMINEDGEQLQQVGKPWSKVRRGFLSLMTLPHQGVMHHRSLFEVHGVFDERFQIAGDYELLLRELAGGEALFIPDVIVTGMQLGGVSNDPAQSLFLMKEMREAHRRHMNGKSGWRWWLAYIKVRVRHALWHWLGEARARKLLDAARTFAGQARYWTRS